MEYFGINFDIDELFQKLLEEIFVDVKFYLMIDGMIEEQWQGEVQDVMVKVLYLENLVNLYVGLDCFIVREQNLRLQVVVEIMFVYVGLEI